MTEERTDYELDQQALDADDGDTSDDTSEGTSDDTSEGTSDDGGLSGEGAAAAGAANAGQLGVTPGTGLAGTIDAS